MAHTLPYLTASGGELLFFGEGGSFLIGPTNERWDRVLLVRQRSMQAFLAFAGDEAISPDSDIGPLPWKIRGCCH